MSATLHVLDIPVPTRPTLESCYRKYVDPHLPHQLQLHAVERRTKVQGRCNCGAAFTPRRPETPGSLEETLSEYDAHVAWVIR